MRHSIENEILHAARTFEQKDNPTFDLTQLRDALAAEAANILRGPALATWIRHLVEVGRIKVVERSGRGHYWGSLTTRYAITTPGIARLAELERGAA